MIVPPGPQTIYPSKAVVLRNMKTLALFGLMSSSSLIAMTGVDYLLWQKLNS